MLRREVFARDRGVSDDRSEDICALWALGVGKEPIQRRSMPTLLTLAFQTMSPFSHAGALSGFGTCFLSPVNTCTLSVPRSRNLMLVCPLLAAFRAAWRGCLLWYTVLVSFPFSISTKYFFSLIEFHLKPCCFHPRL